MPRKLIGFLAAFCVAGCGGSVSGPGTTDGGGGTTDGGGGTTDGGGGTTESDSMGPCSPPLEPGGGTTDGGGGSVEGFVLVEPGTFTMGSPAGELGRVCTEPERGCIAGSGETQYQVTLTQRFYLQRTEVTLAQWTARMGNNPGRSFACGESCPVENVDWWDALAYANATSAAEGLAECYTLTGCSGTPGGGMACADVTVNATGGNPYLCTGYRLPTEAEWEYAYRAGTTTAFYNGGITQTGCCPVDPNLDAIGWFCGNAGGTTHPVAQKAANAWGLYDMAGNLWERVWDGNGDYPSGGVTDPVGPGSGGVRGGSFSNDAASARAAGRSYPDDREYPSGFRLARSAP